MKLKICGLRDRSNIESISKLMPDYLGFIFFKVSQRYAGDVLLPDHLSGICNTISKVGVFVDEDREKVAETVNAYDLDMVQLHGNEPAEYCLWLKKQNIAVIKAFFVDMKSDFKMIAKYIEVCDYFLFDNRGSTGGGSGKKFDWNLLKRYGYNKQYFLSGGIGPSDIDEIIQVNDENLHAIDINSKFEIVPGLKDIDLVTEFINKLKTN